MDADLNVHQIQVNAEKTGTALNIVKSYDYSEHPLYKLIDIDWVSLFISNRILVFEDVVYRCNNPDYPLFAKGSKSFMWNEKCHTKEIDTVSIYEKCRVRRLVNTNLMIAVCQKKK